MLPSSRILFVAFVLALASTRATAQSDKPDHDTSPATASVSGRITVGGEPVSGVSVAVYPQNGGGFPVRAFGKATTDADGRFRVSSLPAGQLVVSPRTPAHVAPREGQGFFTGRVVTLGDGESIENVDMTLVPGGVITGRIVDQDNRPVIGLQVRALSPSDNAFDFFSIERTDDRGVFRIFGLQAGKYRVRAGDEFVAQPGASVRPYTKTYYPGTADEQQAGMIDVTAGSETKNVDFVVRRGASGFAAIGRVVNAATGKPASGVYVMCMPAEPSNLDTLSYSPILTDARGEFRVGGLKPGRYRLNAFTSLGRSSSTYADAVPIDVVAADVVGLEIRLKSGSLIQGTVVFEGRSPGEAGADTANIRVFCFSRPSSTDQMDFVPSMPAQVTAEGTFTIEGVRPGNAQIGLDTWNGPKGLTLLRVEREGAVIDDSFEVREGENVTGLRLVAAFGTGSIRGRVVARGGEPVVGTGLYARAHRPGEKQQFGNKTAAVDGRSQFLIEGLVDGEYEVIVSAVSHVGMPGGEESSKPKRVTVTGNQPVEVTIEIEPSKSQPEDPE
jgi:hypothetical protein